MTRVSELFQDFQDLDAPIPTAGLRPEDFARQKEAAFQTLFDIDDRLSDYLDNLPNIFSVNPVHINYATESRYPRLKVYRQVIIGSVYFIRILLHRPFMLNSRRFGEAEGHYRTCWRRCVDTAIRDLRLRNMWRLTLSEIEQVSHQATNPFRRLTLLLLAPDDDVRRCLGRIQFGHGAGDLVTPQLGAQRRHRPRATEGIARIHSRLLSTLAR